MPNRDEAPVGAPCWVDLTTSDTGVAREFYTALFGWEAEEPNPEFGGYFNFTKNGVRVAGGMSAMPGGAADVWSVYLATDDAAKAFETAVANGAQPIVTPMPVGDLGTMLVIVDGVGAVIGAWQPGEHKGFGLIGEAGAPAWFELHTREYDKAVAFYREVFRWDTKTESDTPEFRYTVMVDGDNACAGIMDASGFLAEGATQCWSTYFGVDDADAAVARVVELGGTVLEPATDTPYGRLAAVADPLGARFKLVAPNA